MKKQRNEKEKTKKWGGKIQHWHVISMWLMMFDVAAICLSYFGALWIRFDCHFQEIPREYFRSYYYYIWIYAAFCVLIFYRLRLYRSIWRFASYSELWRMAAATVVTAGCYILGMTLFVQRMPIAYYLFGIVLQFLMTIGVRFAYRFVLLLRGRNNSTEAKKQKHVMLVGAGAAGQMILRDIKSAKETDEQVCCFIDDNSNKWNRYIDSVPVVGGRENIMEACKKYQIQKIYITMPSASPADKREILNLCNETGCEMKNLPGMYQLYTGEITVSKMKNVAVEDLLGRDPIRVNMEEIFQYVKGKVILVTGGGGSIGSVRDSRKIFQVFETYRPEIVYHAAAHKHVPLMEDSPCEAIKNNAIGTYKTAYAAICHGCKKFVLISTDKAVNPTNIMGASKRLCEMIIQAFDYKVKEKKADEIPQLFTHSMKDMVQNPEIAEALQHTETEFVAVRFGNVLGSNGSVIPLFKKQIEAGGPVTVTHPDIIRYFMTIPEAVSLVLQAGTYAKGGEIFVLDMGEPVKIDTLARNLIRLSGHKPDVDIKIEYSGLRDIIGTTKKNLCFSMM